MKKRRYDEKRETSNRRVHKIIHIGEVTGCCLRCAIRQRQDWYYESSSLKHQSSFPSWKLTSKNKKQWMWKRTRIEKNNRHPDFWYKTIIW